MNQQPSFFHVYILRTSSNTLYIGQTNDLKQRMKEHKSKKTKSAKYLRYFPSFELMFTEMFPTRIAAMRRERELKTYSRAKKEALIDKKS